MHDFALSGLAASVAADAVCRLLDGGTLRLYAGPRPAAADSPPVGQTLLAELRFAVPAFAGALDGVARAHALTAETEAPTTGNADYFRACAADGTPIFDGTVGAGGDFDLALNTTQIHAGARVSVESLLYTQPMG